MYVLVLIYPLYTMYIVYVFTVFTVEQPPARPHIDRPRGTAGMRKGGKLVINATPLGMHSMSIFTVLPPPPLHHSLLGSLFPHFHMPAIFQIFLYSFFIFLPLAAFALFMSIFVQPKPKPQLRMRLRWGMGQRIRKDCRWHEAKLCG